MARIFTDEELDTMGKSTCDLIMEVLDNGNIEKGKKLVRRMRSEFQAMHDLYCNWVTGLLSYIGRNFGEDKVLEAERVSVETWLKPLLKIYAGVDIRRKVEIFAMGLRGHLHSVKIEEDDEKVTFILDPCPSGGRIMKGETGYADFLKLSKPSLVTFGRTDWPVYCTHCPMDEILSIEWVGEPFFITEPPVKTGEEPCRISIYKDSSEIPEIVYKRVGKMKSK